jgi:hypothetical protein
MPDGLAGGCFTPRTAGETTKCTKHTKNERLKKRIMHTHFVDTLVAANLRDFGHFGRFVVQSRLPVAG